MKNICSNCDHLKIEDENGFNRFTCEIIHDSKKEEEKEMLILYKNRTQFVKECNMYKQRIKLSKEV